MGILKRFRRRPALGHDDTPAVMSHYLYFADRLNAEDAATLLRERRFEVTAELSVDGINWLVLVRHSLAEWRGRDTPPSDYFDAIARHFEGEYDGWEIGPQVTEATL